MFKRPLFWLVCLLFILSGCSGGIIKDAEQSITPVDQITLPDGVRVIGLGEATHGNVEFQQLKMDVFKSLMVNEGIHVFVLEGDFGGGRLINDFIQTGEGTAREVVNALDYSIYRTEQMVELVQWMHDFNQKVNSNEKIAFYGMDMQRYDYNKQGLLDFYKVVNGKAVETLAKQLSNISNEKMWELSKEELKDTREILDHIIADLASYQEDYVERSSAEEYALALQCAKILVQRTELLLIDNKSYTQLRDRYLAENLQWIMDYEAGQGHDKVFVTAHNGHIEKTSSSLAGYKSMGNYLDEQFGEEYFAIGTDFMDNTFQAMNSGAGRREPFKVKNHNDLLDGLQDVKANEFYLDFVKANESDRLSNIIHSKQRMGNIGDDFRTWYKISKIFYTIKMIPAEAYDSLIIIKKATPTKVLENGEA